MSAVDPSIPQNFKELSPDAQIRVVQNLWDFIAENPRRVPVPESHKKVLDERSVSRDLDSIEGESWASLRERLLVNLRER